MSKEIYISSDHHFAHKNILIYCKNQRNCETLDEMHEKLIENHNSVVGKTDEVYFLGDFCFSKTEGLAEQFLSRLNGKIYFVFGNHDHWVKTADFTKINNTIVLGHYHEFKPFNDLSHVILFHFPIQSWHRKNYGSHHYFGHAHGQFKTPGEKRMDVGVDCNRMYPFNLREIMESLNENSNR
jgi:calcineurin-like phosphoesterase family protein